MKTVDLHVHSTKSDGSLTPSELVDLALEKGLSAMALTDHDTVEGLDEILAYAADEDIEIVPGIELSTEYHGKDIHVVGLCLEYHRPDFQQMIHHFVDARVERNHIMCGKLNAYGIDITYEELTREFPDSVITRAHYARYMLKQGYIKTIAEAFDKYIGDDCPCFVPREKVTPMQGVELIRAAHGIPILAHPTLYHMTLDELQILVTEMIEVGMVGIEGLYSTFTPEQEKEIQALARRNGLIISGGSDFHGACKPGLELGTGYHHTLCVPYSVWEGVKAKKAELYPQDCPGG